jgi:pimeloyl-ACP methyl ester carboxylesterase
VAVVFDQQRVQTQHGPVEYLDVGTGTPTLYFHGTGAGNDAALLLEQPLLKSGCRLIIPNRPGYYGTALGCQGSAEFCANLAADLLNHLGVRRAIVMGTSGGGMPAASFARCHPDRTAGLVLQCAQSHQWTGGKWLPDGLGHALFLFRHRIFTPFLRWQNTRHAEASRRQPITCLRHMSGSRFPEVCDDLNAVQQITDLTIMTLSCAAAPQGIQNDWAIMVRDNGVTQDAIRCPTLIIHDRADPLVPFMHAEWSQSCIPASRLLAIHAGGHLIWFGKDSALMHMERVAFIREHL